MKFSEKHANVKTIKTTDLMRSTDQIIYGISQKKDDLNQKFLKLLKNNAVDAALNKNVHRSSVTIPKLSSTKEGYMYYLGNISGDIKDKKDDVEEEREIPEGFKKLKFAKSLDKTPSYMMKNGFQVIYKKEDMKANNKSFDVYLLKLRPVLAGVFSATNKKITWRNL